MARYSVTYQGGESYSVGNLTFHRGVAKTLDESQAEQFKHRQSHGFFVQQLGEAPAAAPKPAPAKPAPKPAPAAKPAAAAKPAPAAPKAPAVPKAPPAAPAPASAPTGEAAADGAEQ